MEAGTLNTLNTLEIQPKNGAGYHATFTGGTFNVADHAVLDLTGGVDSYIYYTGTYTGSGAGTVSLNSGTLNINGSGGATQRR